MLKVSSVVILAGLLAPSTEPKTEPPRVELPPLVCGFLCYPDGRCLIPPVSCVETPKTPDASRNAPEIPPEAGNFQAR